MIKVFSITKNLLIFHLWPVVFGNLVFDEIFILGFFCHCEFCKLSFSCSEICLGFSNELPTFKIISGTHNVLPLQCAH